VAFTRTVPIIDRPSARNGFKGTSIRLSYSRFTAGLVA
jgi:hypothetical protein